MGSGSSKVDDDGEKIDPYRLGIRSYIREQLSKRVAPFEGEVYAEFAAFLSSDPYD